MQSSRYSNRAVENRTPEVFYGYCHDSGRMRMMDFTDFMTNLGKGYSNLYQSPAATAALGNSGTYPFAPDPRRQAGCRCHEQEDDCGCNCCVRCADAVEYAYCGETRRIPITFDNDSRREREVAVTLGEFLTDGGRPLAWEGALSEERFSLPPCGRKTLIVTVRITCPSDKASATRETAAKARATRTAGTESVDACTVGYARLNADGCLIRPLVLAIAVMPDHCGAREVECLCGGCC